MVGRRSFLLGFGNFSELQGDRIETSKCCFFSQQVFTSFQRFPETSKVRLDFFLDGWLKDSATVWHLFSLTSDSWGDTNILSRIIFFHRAFCPWYVEFVVRYLTISTIFLGMFGSCLWNKKMLDYYDPHIVPIGSMGLVYSPTFTIKNQPFM